MSHYMTALAMKQTGLKPATKVVLYWLADHYNDETGGCFPSLKTLERECEMSRAAIVRHLDALEGLGLIVRKQRCRENGSQTSTAYDLCLKPVPKRNSPCSKTKQPPVSKRDPHNLVNINQVKRDTNVSLQKGDFEAFWKVCPKKVGKGAAEKAYAKALKEADPQAIEVGMRVYADQRSGQDHTFTAHPATWLNQKRWTDETTNDNFHDQIRSMLNDDDLRTADAIGNEHGQRLLAPVASPDAPQRGRQDDEAAPNGGSDERQHWLPIRPRRFP